MLIAHAGLIGFALEFGFVLVPVLIFLKLRKKYKPTKVGAPPTAKKIDPEATGEQSGPP